MGRVVLLTVLAVSLGGLLAVSGAARTPASGGSPAPAGFRLADSSAGCAFDGSRVACRTATMSSAVVLQPDGSSAGADVAVEWNDTTPVLRRTEIWWHDGFSCRIDGADIVCERSSGSIAVGPGGVGGASSVTDVQP